MFSSWCILKLLFYQFIKFAMACLQGTYQCSMNRMNNIKRKIISDFCCALCARGVFNGISTRMSFPKTIPMSIPRARPIDGYTNPIIIPVHTPMVCHRLVILFFWVCASIISCFVCRPANLCCCLHGKYFVVCCCWRRFPWRSIRHSWVWFHTLRELL